MGLLGVRDDLVRRCLFHPTAAAWERVSALSQVKSLPSVTGSTLVAVGGGRKGGWSVYQ